MPGPDANAAVRQHLPSLRGSLSGHLSVWWLRARLLFDGSHWAERAGATTVTALDRIGHAVEILSWKTARATVRAIEWRRVALVASEPFVLPAEFRAAMVRVFAYLGAIGAMSLIAAETFKAPQATAMLETLRPSWIDVERPWPAFQLAMPGFNDDDSHYSIRRHVETGGRKDTLSFGEFGKTQRFISFEIYRAGREIEEFGSPAEDIRALGAEYGRVSGIQSALPIPSKFGEFQTFEFAIGPFSGYKCVGFVRGFDAPRVQIGGLSCNMNLLVDRSAISCALDRLTLMSAGSDPDIARLFAQAELKRSFCGQRDHLLYATPKRPGEVAQAMETPRLRGRIAR